MRSQGSPNGRTLEQLIGSHVSGYSLERDFYVDEAIYRADIERVWRRGWLFAGHSCEIADPGDYFTFELENDSLIILRDDGGEAHAFHNVCRHRGMRLLGQESGHVNRIACPYHQWIYGRDGSLLSCRGMHQIDTSVYGLRRLPVEEAAGLIFISLADPAGSFEPARALLDAMVAAQGLGHAKVAKVVDYEIGANWKLVWENNRECWHCNANHPQYIKANFDHYNLDDTPERIKQQVAAVVARSEAEWADAGLAVSYKQPGMTVFPDVDNDVWFSTNRTALAESYVSETMDGRQVAPLMGNYSGTSVGTLRIRTLPNFWNHSSCDHSVSTRLLPAGPQQTRARVTWLVDKDAVEGKDYELERLLPFWKLTSEQDWEICENQQRGVRSSAYAPGPYSMYKEYNVNNFVCWYLKMMAMSAG